MKNNSNIYKFLEKSTSAFFGLLFLSVPTVTVYNLTMSFTKDNILISIGFMLATLFVSFLVFVRFEQWVMKESQVYGDAQVYEMIFLVTALCYSLTMLLLSILPKHEPFDVWKMVPWTITASLLYYAGRLANLKKYPRNENADPSREWVKSQFILFQMVIAGCVHAYAVLALIHAYIGGLFPIVEVVIGGFFFALGVLLAIKRATRPFPFRNGGLS